MSVLDMLTCYAVHFNVVLITVNQPSILRGQNAGIWRVLIALMAWASAAGLVSPCQCAGGRVAPETWAAAAT